MDDVSDVTKLSIVDSLCNKNILLIGATGFLGKVLLAMLLEKVPSIGKIFILIRNKEEQNLLTRFTESILLSPVFLHLQQPNEVLTQRITQHIKIFSGDSSLPDLGVDKPTFNYLTKQIDLVINCAGLVDFFPEIEQALNNNVKSVIYAAEFTRQCQHAKLIHISTCYVAPNQSGYYKETILTPQANTGEAWNAYAEINYLLMQINNIRAQGLSKEETSKEQINLGKSRANIWEFHNTYCYTKALAEWILQQDYADLSYSIIRPSIIESALFFPMTGWNAGFNTTAPLTFLLGHWYPYLVGKNKIIIDLIPVDVVCQNIILIAAALMQNCAERIYQLGSSSRNPLKLQDAVQYARTWHRNKPVASLSGKILNYLKTFKNAAVIETNHPLAPQKIADFFSKIETKISKLPNKYLADKMQNYVRVVIKVFLRLAKIHRLFQPFTHDNNYIFATDAIQKLQSQEDYFNYNIGELNWEDYYLKTHVPGLAVWVFPRLANKSVQQGAMEDANLGLNLESLILDILHN